MSEEVKETERERDRDTESVRASELVYANAADHLKCIKLISLINCFVLSSLLHTVVVVAVDATQH